MRPILLIIWTAFQSFILREKVFKKGLYFSVLSALPFFKKVWIKNKNPKIIYIYIYIVTKIQNKKFGDIDKTAFNPGNCSGKIILIIATDGGVQLSIISI